MKKTNETPYIFILIVDLLNLLILVTTIIFLFFVLMFIIRGNIFLAIFESFFFFLFLSITVILRKLRLTSFK